MVLRVLVYDRTDGPLSVAWKSGSGLYRALRRIDASKGVASWDEAFAWLATLEQPIHELQYWGHGKWGAVHVDRDVLDARALLRDHPYRGGLDLLRSKLAPDPLVWFRTCETFGARPGIAFAEQLAEFLGARVAGHTFVIGFHQSGLHGLAPGRRADWDDAEGLAAGTPESPLAAKNSRPWAPRTITCLAGRAPTGWFA